MSVKVDSTCKVTDTSKVIKSVAVSEKKPKDCLCPFPPNGGFELDEPQETVFWNYFKEIVEDRFMHKAEFTRSRAFRKTMASFKENMVKCTGSLGGMTNDDAGDRVYRKLESKYPTFKEDIDYRKICMELKGASTGYSYDMFNTIFNNNKLNSVYALNVGGNSVWGGCNPPPGYDEKKKKYYLAPGVAQLLGMDNFQKIHSKLDHKIYPELAKIGYDVSFFKYIAFVMLLHEVVEGHYMQNIGFYRNNGTTATLGTWVKGDHPYITGHLFALLAQAKELGVDMVISKWINMDEREFLGGEHDYDSFATTNINGAQCLVTYKKRDVKTYTKCTYAFRVKNHKFYDEVSADGRRWNNTFGCIMEKSPVSGDNPMTGIISVSQYNYEIANYIDSLNFNYNGK